MLKGILEATAGMMARGIQHEKVSQNLANANTTGYKSHHLAYTNLIDQEIARLQMAGRNGLTLLAPGQYTDFTPGAFQSTGNDLDLALRDRGFFVVRNAAGTEFYTRNGCFHRNDEGQLVNSDNLPVLGEGGEILLGAGRVDISVDGVVSQRGSEVDRLKVVNFESGAQLAAVGHSLYRSVAADAAPQTVEYPQVVQGSLEESNVDIVSELVDLIELQRVFEFTQRAILAQDETLGRAINQVGTVSG